MFCSSIGFFEIVKSRFGDLGGVEGWGVVVGVVVVVMVVVIIVFGIIISVIIMVVVVVVVFFGFICVVLAVVVAILQIQIPHRRGRIKSSRPCFPTSQIPMIRKRSRNVRGSLRTIGTGCVGFLLIGFVAAAAVQRNSTPVILNTSSTTTTHHRAPDISLLSLIRNFQPTNRNRRAIRNTSKAQSEHRFTFSRAGSRTFLR